jgi:hypothetical protein
VVPFRLSLEGLTSGADSDQSEITNVLRRCDTKRLGALAMGWLFPHGRVPLSG